MKAQSPILKKVAKLQESINVYMEELESLMKSQEFIDDIEELQETDTVALDEYESATLLDYYEFGNALIH